jgi:23S rRNA (adenine-N6)-dimethyltransferase
VVLDIGAGTGAITQALHEAGARVLAIELNPRRAAVLSERWTNRGVTVVRADASDLRLPRQPFKVVSNLPFSITTAVVKRLVSHGSRMTSAHLIVPRYAAHRWADPSAPGSRRWRRLFDVQLGRPPPRCAFRPPPPGDVALLVISLRPAHGSTRGAGAAGKGGENFRGELSIRDTPVRNEGGGRYGAGIG